MCVKFLKLETEKTIQQEQQLHQKGESISKLLKYIYGQTIRIRQIGQKWCTERMV